MSFREVTTAERLTHPYSAVGIVFVTWPDGSRSSGSAAVVGRNDILTAAHIVYSPDRGGWATDFDFYFGADYNKLTGRFEDYGYSLTSGFRWEIRAGISGSFQDSNNSRFTSSESQYDVAIIGVSVEIGKQTGWFGLAPGRDFTQTAIVAGYPRGATGMMTERVTVESSLWWGIYQGISQVDSGSSGGPLFTDENYIIGVTSANSGPGTQTTWADIGFSWHWIKPFLDYNDYLLTSSVKPTVATYTLSALTDTVNEGVTAVFTLTTTNVPVFTTLTYRLTGVQADDIVSGRLTGTVVVGADGRATILIPIKKDLTTEGDETLRVIVESTDASITIKDTSRVINYSSGDKYVGDVINGLRHGEGTYYFLDSNQFNGDVYTGNFKEGKFHGQGKYAFANGNVYVGGFNENLYDGQGELTIAGSNKYAGEFKDGNFEGEGTQTFFNVGQYVGEFKNGMRDGQGTFTFNDGRVHKGEFREDNLLPSTYEITATSSSVFEGETAIFTVKVTNFRSDEWLEFKISGVQTEDILTDGWLIGSALVGVDGTANIPIPIAADNVREGHEKMTVTIMGQSASIIINDTIIGGVGTNTVEYDQSSTNYALSRKNDGEIEIIFHSGARERLIGIEKIIFADKSIDSKDAQYVGTYTDITGTNSQATHRFYNTRDKAFFYTADPSEKDSVLLSSTPNAPALADTSWPYVYQGSTFKKAHSYEGASPLYRFYNTETGHHFFTASKGEADYVRAKSDSGEWPFNYEGVAFNVYASDPNPDFEGTEVAVHRFYSSELNRHFYTASESEVAEIKLTGQWNYEGIGFWGEG